ncbi:membrane-bound alkaline phosphatase-like [Anticarsia gemmatalis]|uniref:membrane-bound alkaline phosphatase-like n=1 Tax=Anticarsia gemmatalis TaxID=129554 RepID=UPI003F7710C5
MFVPVASRVMDARAKLRSVVQVDGGVKLSAMRLVVAVVCAASCTGSARADQYHPPETMVRSGPPNSRETSADYWFEEAQKGIAARLSQPQSADVARNVILFLGDGMSLSTIVASRIHYGQKQGATGEEASLSFESFPTTGLSKTYCTNAQVPDSACTATAYLCGVKTNQGFIGVRASIKRGDCKSAQESANQLSSIAEWMIEDGRDVGVVTSARVTHASPAGVYAKVPERRWEDDAHVVRSGVDPSTCPDIAYQLVHMHPGNKIKVILGGGRSKFLPSTVVEEDGTRGLRTDNRNLIKDWEDSKVNSTYKVIRNRDELMQVNQDPPEYLLGLFNGSHLRYNLDADKNVDPTLAELTETAIKALSRNKRGYFLFVEGGRIDHGHHVNMARLALDETLQLSEAVARARRLVSERDTLVVVTADHSHVMTFNGYPPRGHDILGSTGAANDSQGVPYMTLSYATGPGWRRHVAGKRPNVLLDKNYGSLRWRSHTDIPTRAETHSGEDAVVFASGPRHEMFAGVYEQSQLPHRMAYAACVGRGARACPAGLSAPAGVRAAARRLAAAAAALASSAVAAVALPMLRHTLLLSKLSF